MMVAHFIHSGIMLRWAIRALKEEDAHLDDARS